jgi:uncharacterized protein YndB with AHSA1/START domain
MTDPSVIADQVRVSVLVEVALEIAFKVFTEDIDVWWRRGRKYRFAGPGRGMIHLEPWIGGRLFESFDGGVETKIFETGTVTAWEPPSRIQFEWRAANFSEGESTTVEVLFQPRPNGTLVTVVHGGWGKIRLDHPARHGLDVAAFIRMMGFWWSDLMNSFRDGIMNSEND